MEKSQRDKAVNGSIYLSATQATLRRKPPTGRAAQAPPASASWLLMGASARTTLSSGLQGTACPYLGLQHCTAPGPRITRQGFFRRLQDQRGRSAGAERGQRRWEPARICRPSISAPPARADTRAVLSTRTPSGIPRLQSAGLLFQVVWCARWPKEAGKRARAPQGTCWAPERRYRSLEQQHG